ncbi:hypothetical protein K437DRAFT_86540 [Tilletiaria anomala UBC 951]|uniref:Uncharacterized protein n=1 Tax=Tilletiaria anomala (strain ATCC 24038 / CBS 436.72 / UBC 951) TaxID=1037660 RepID=A0A066W7G3_TILAU|nr:uncharacterized protein K437DRAFT_86540 [Tilletiaria anomala UBC 951]KDN48473.1 hypothetical protein K437DRAFT_86540 [Tilletiaria anomala UBC 951]
MHISVIQLHMFMAGRTITTIQSLLRTLHHCPTRLHSSARRNGSHTLSSSTSTWSSNDAGSTISSPRQSTFLPAPRQLLPPPLLATESRRVAVLFLAHTMNRANQSRQQRSIRILRLLSPSPRHRDTAGRLRLQSSCHSLMPVRRLPPTRAGWSFGWTPARAHPIRRHTTRPSLPEMCQRSQDLRRRLRKRSEGLHTSEGARPKSLRSLPHPRRLRRPRRMSATPLGPRPTRDGRGGLKGHYFLNSPRRPRWVAHIQMARMRTCSEQEKERQLCRPLLWTRSRVSCRQYAAGRAHLLHARPSRPRRDDTASRLHKRRTLAREVADGNTIAMDIGFHKRGAGFLG